MKTRQRQLMLEHLDKKLMRYKDVKEVLRPEKGWLHALRSALNISLTQLAETLKRSPQAIKGVEEREADGSITINTLKDVAEAMDMKLIYAIVPKDESLDKLVERRAQELAYKIVMRTSASMKLEDQENSQARIDAAIAEKTREIKEEMPKHLWQ